MMDLVFPMLAISRFTVGGYSSLEHMRYCRAYSLKTDFFQNLALYSSDRRKYIVRRYSANPSLLDKIFNRMVRIDLELESAGNIDRSALEQEVFDAIEQNSEFYESAWTIDELKGQINNACSIAEIIDFFGYF